MKRLMLLPAFLLFFLKTSAQDRKWMYLFSNQGLTMMVDTSTNDVNHFDTYETQTNVVLIWLKTVQKKSNKNGSFVESIYVHYAIDTTNKQMEIRSSALYHNDKLRNSYNGNFLWQDVIPGSGGDILINFCRALNNQQLMKKFILNAYQHDHKASKN